MGVYMLFWENSKEVDSIAVERGRESGRSRDKELWETRLYRAFSAPVRALDFILK